MLKPAMVAECEIRRVGVRVIPNSHMFHVGRWEECGNDRAVQTGIQTYRLGPGGLAPKLL